MHRLNVEIQTNVIPTPQEIYHKFIFKIFSSKSVEGEFYCIYCIVWFKMNIWLYFNNI